MSQASVRFAYRLQRVCVLLVIAFLGQYANAQQSPEGNTSEFPELYNSEAEPGDPIPPQEALDALRLPDGFSAQLFASEPMVQNPIAACTDLQGRVWVAENYTYAERSMKFDLELNDRVVVLIDGDEDGHAEQRVVFTDQVKMLTGIAVGRGGVWLMCPPQLLFIPDADGDARPDGPPEVKLDGFHVATENYHNFANGLSWGPDGWLYGRCGASCPGEMGLPGCAEEQRVPLRGGIWRFHPERLVVEALNQGTTNPWGHDWNHLGDLFFINTVNGHFWHLIPGAHYVRPHTLDVHPHVYELIDMHADHWHFDTGKSWTASRDGAANDFGGGHAHIGMMIYQEDTWPEDYKGRVMTVNMHGRRVNTEKLIHNGSGYVAQHAPDFVLSDDTWFRGMELLPLPDGNVLLFDWSDTGECHDHTGVHRTSGRVFKIVASSGSKPGRNLTLDVPDAEIAAAVTDGPEWRSRKARELLQWRAEISSESSIALRKLMSDPVSPVSQRLRALWALNSVASLSRGDLMQLLSDEEPAVRSWGIRLLTDNWPLDMVSGDRPVDERRDGDASPYDSQVIQTLVNLASREGDSSVRLTLASTLQRLELRERSRLAGALLSHAGDAGDHNLPLMVWYGITALAEERPQELVELLRGCQWPTTRKLIARRLAGLHKQNPETTNQVLAVALANDAAFRADVVLGMATAMAGWSRADQPKAWPATQASLANSNISDVKEAIRNLSILFGDGRTVTQLTGIVSDGKNPLEQRKAALKSLVDARAEGIKDLCIKLLNQRFLNTVAATGLASENDPAIGRRLLDAYRRFHPSERDQVISILCSRASWAEQLLQDVAAGKIDRAAISAFQARQIANFNSRSLDELLLESWGQVRVTAEEKRQFLAKVRAEVRDGSQADATQGRALFVKNCSNCHKMFGVGGALGPDLTGAQRSNLDYLLDNIGDPSAVVTKEFRATVIATEDGRVLTGLLTEEDENTLTLATQNEVHRIPADEVLDRKLSNASTMPEGLLEQMSEQQRRDLFAYLQSTQQVALPSK